MRYRAGRPRSASEWFAPAVRETAEAVPRAIEFVSRAALACPCAVEARYEHPAQTIVRIRAVFFMAARCFLCGEYTGVQQSSRARPRRFRAASRS